MEKSEHIPREVILLSKDLEALKEIMIEQLFYGYIDSAIEVIDKFKISSEILSLPEVQEAAKQGIINKLSSGHINDAIAIIDKLKIPTKIIQEAAKKSLTSALVSRDVYTAIENKDFFERGTLITDEAIVKDENIRAEAEKCLAANLDTGVSIEKLLEFSAMFKLGQEKALQKVYDDFGEFINYEIYHIYKEMLDGRIPELLASFKIKQAGESGINQFKQKLRGLQKELLQGNLDESILKNKDIQPWLMGIIGYSQSDWGEHDDKAFKRTIETYLKNKDDIAPLPPEYEESKTLKIDKADKEKQTEFKHMPAFLSRYDTILRSLQEAHSLLGKSDNGVIPILERLSNVREYEINRIDEQIFKLQQSEMPEDKKVKAVAGLQGQKAVLDSLDLKNIKPGQGPQEIFKALSSFEAFEEDLRTLVFYASYRMNPGQRQSRVKEFSKNNPTLEELSWLMNFTDHITNQETFSKYFSDRESLKRFNGLLNISALQQEMARMQNQTKKGAMSFQFVPTRNLLTEFSGHIADACWAGKYESILKAFPNFTSLIMVQNPEKEKDARLAGAALLIETETENDPDETLGEPLLVIRGLNPKENVINQLVVEDFYKKVVDYLKPIAKKQGRKLAIVIDDHCGGAATNRPVLFTYLEQLKEQLIKVRLMELTLGDDSTFNDYRIIDDVYFVE